MFWCGSRLRRAMNKFLLFLIEGHTDMVAIKVPESAHNFETDPIDLVVEGNYVRGNNTTLGADNGCAVAIMLAILDDNALPHPALECLFTVQEEVGLCGIMGFDLSQIKARRVIGLDAGSDGVFRKGVSSKYLNQFSIPIQRETMTGRVYSIKINGLLGGHPSVAIPADRGLRHKAYGQGSL